MKKIHLNLTQKLLFWSFTLIAIFLITTSFLFYQIHRIVNTSDNIVNIHYNITQKSDDLIEDILALIEYKNKYEILSEQEYKENYEKEFSEFKKKFTEYMDIPEVNDTYKNLAQNEKLAKQSILATQKSSFLQDSELTSWMNTFSAIRSEHRYAIREELHDLQKQADAASHTGFLGLSASIVVAACGSFLLAFFMNRSTKEVKRGIQQIGQNGQYTPIRVRSNDEIGELSHVFNEMSARLKQEDERRSDFISMLSHEIRTPLTTIRESLNMLREETLGKVNPQQKHLIALSSQEIERITLLLNRLMYASSLENNELQLSLTRESVAELIDTCVKRMEPLAKRKNIEIVQEIETNTSIVADRDHIQQVLINLIGNALKFSLADSTVTVRFSQNGQKKKLFQIIDQGQAIPESERHYVFDKYYRAKRTSKKLDGAGLGLHISRKIVEAHGGSIGVRPYMNSGNIFYFFLPPIVQTQNAISD